MDGRGNSCLKDCQQQLHLACLICVESNPVNDCAHFLIKDARIFYFMYQLDQVWDSFLGKKLMNEIKNIKSLHWTKPSPLLKKL